MNKTTIVLASILVLTIVLAPSIAYFYCENKYTPVIDSYKGQVGSMQDQVDALNQQKSQLIADNSQLTNLSEPHFIELLGWYLHKSDDPVASSKNSFTIYGTIYNIGDEQANNTELTVRFYDNSSLLQQSTIHIGVISPLGSGPQQYCSLNSNIDCSPADQVTNIEVAINYS